MPRMKEPPEPPKPPKPPKVRKSKAPKLPPAAVRLGEREALNETFEKAHGEVELLRKQGALVAYRRGKRLCTIRDLELYKDGGFDIFTDYLKALKGASVRTYFRCIDRYEAIAEALVEELEAERLDLAAALLPHEKGKTPTITPEALAKLQVTVERDGRKVTVPFRDAETEELSEAARRRNKKDATPPKELIDKAARLARRLGHGSTAIADVKVVKLGKKHAFSLLVPADRFEAFEKLLKG